MHGYEHQEVHKFFSPLEQAVKPEHQSIGQRPYGVYLDAEGYLINEGIVASQVLIDKLSEEIGTAPLYRVEHAGLIFTAFPTRDETSLLAVRNLGRVKLKGMAPTGVFELVQLPKPADPLQLDPIYDKSLVEAAAF